MIANPPVARRPKVLVIATEDWFVVSHFLPLLKALRGLGCDVAVVTRVREKAHEIAATGARLIAFDFARGDFRAFRDGAIALRLLRLLRCERPDAIHAIALKPIVLTSLIYSASNAQRFAVHLTGVGYAGTVDAGRTATLYQRALRLVARTLGLRSTWLFVENPDDALRLAPCRALAENRVTILGGAGVDPSGYPETPLPAFAPPRIGFVGRMVWSKGVDVLVAAHRLLSARNSLVETHLCGAPDVENPRAIPLADLESWNAEPGLSWRGAIRDVAGFWRETAIAVVPSRGGEGLPRALLEAAVCGRPIIATDVPGCREFVRDGIEGLIVPPEDPEALATAIARLVRDPTLAARMGAAARRRVLEAFTEQHVIAAIQQTYRGLLEGLPAS